MILDLSSPAAVVCHDAGAANIILAWMQAEGARDWQTFLQGPAARLWSGLDIPGVQLCETLEQALDGACVLLSGTGWQSDLEHEARRHSRARCIKSIAVIDHWVHYRDRFVRQGEFVLPDEIYVTDDYALDEAQRCFPDVKVQSRPNLYLEGLLKQITPCTSTQTEVLYVLEPMHNDWGRQVQGEFQALDYFAANIGTLGITPDALIRLRPHPSDAPGKYDEWITQHKELNLALDDSLTPAAAISNAEWVVGCETYAMVIALAAGRRVVSTLPPWAHRCRLPHTGIIHLRDADR